MAVKCQAVFRLIEEFAPLSLAEKWDNVGLQLGDPLAETNKILLTLDVNKTVAEEALDQGAGLIISHHPLFFKPVRRLSFDLPSGELVAFLIRSYITVYTAHTNLDGAAGGVSAVLAGRLGLENLTVLSPAASRRYVKLVVFVPSGHEDAVRDALTGAGAGWIGNYRDCTFQTRGTGTFRPLTCASPFIGRQGELEQVEEIRLETIIPVEKTGMVVEAMLEAHPYEEVAYDIYSLANPEAAVGLGRLGRLPEPVSFRKLVEHVKAVLGLEEVKAGGLPERVVKKVAVCGGAGAELWPLALQSGADVLVTGDINYHTGQEMLAEGINFIDAGHHATERVILPVLSRYLEESCRAGGLEAQVLISQVNTNPFTYF
ncbi:MAG: Nif3-like dinuclear metal center hexameric protein [Peptococcaceae bacterium]|jgi:dinuclear metal center YbgI/SA1388 family protein|nr:MAG: Nif3-like dinuclear metal center hexameric protein [Peptococcaceae bacterium]